MKPIRNQSWSKPSHMGITPRVGRELAKLPRELYARFLWVGELLADYGPKTVGMPHVRFLREVLWEMRLNGKDGRARAICVTATERRLVVVHVFQKKTRKTPTAALELARQRAQEVT